MGFIDTALAVFFGNLITVGACAALWQFHKLDYRAPWWAYGAFLIPLFLVIGTLLVTGQPPSQTGALAPR